MLWKILTLLVFVGVIGGVTWLAQQPSPVSQQIPLSGQEQTPEPVSAPQPLPATAEPEEKVDAKTVAMPAKAESPVIAPAKPPQTPKVLAAPSSLNGSDDAWRKAVADAGPGLLKYLVPREQIRKWVLVVDLMADRKMLNKTLPLDFAMPAFEILGSRQSPVLDPVNFDRMTPLIRAISRLDSQQLAAYYKAWRPLFDQAYGELGKRGRFDERLDRAIANVLSVQPLQGKIGLKRPKVMYQYADPAKEAAPDLDKWLWRLGPENLSVLQGSLKKFQQALR